MPRSPDTRFLLTLASITLIGPLSVHVFLPVMPVVQQDFGMSSGQVGATFSVTLFVMAFVTLLYGSLSDRYGRRPVLLVGLVLFALGSAMAALASSVAALITGRVVQALGAGAGVTLSRAIARDAYGTDRLVKVIAYLTMAYTLGPMLAPLVGGMLLDASGWRAVFWFITITGVLIAIAAWRVLYETHHPEPAKQASGGLLRNYAALFRQLRFTSYVLQSGFSTGSFIAMGAASAFLMKDYLGRSATEFALYFLVFPVGYFFGNLASSRLSQRFPIETMVFAGSAINLVAVLFQAGALLTGHVTPLTLFLPALVTTFGQGVALPNAQVGAIRVIPSLAGTAAGIGVFFQNFLGAVFAQFYALLADGTPIPMVITVLTGTVLTMVVGVIPFLMKREEAAVQG